MTTATVGPGPAGPAGPGASAPAPRPRRPRGALRSVAAVDQGVAAVDQGVAELAPADPPPPAYRVNVSGRTYRYSTAGMYGRAMYERIRAEDDGGYEWQPRADLPHVHARIVLRDAGGRRTGTEYLISATADGPRIRATEEDLLTGTWAARLGFDLSSDRAIITAAGTAVRHMAHHDAPEREATPRPDVHSATGHLDLPPAECLPDGYLRMPPGVTVAEVRAVWAEVAAIVARLPKMALTVGASAAAPFVGPMRRQSHWWDLYGEQRKGKSTAQALAAAVWGDPRIGTGIVLAWNTSAIGTSRHLGQLGILPPFLDERGVTPNQSAAGWGELIYATSQGSSRLTAEPRGPGTRRSSPWFGVLFSNGNGRLTAGLASGRFAGVPARVIELAAPFTNTAAESEHLAELLSRCYGWLGQEILTRYTVPAVRELLVWADGQIPAPDGGVPRTIAGHLQTAVAGAAMADAILGTAPMLAEAAITAARAHLAEHNHTPEHDADRMLSALADSVAGRRSAWPTVAEYAELARPFSTSTAAGGPAAGRAELAQHGYDHEASGIRSDCGTWLYVRTGTWAELADPLGVDSSVALAELHRRGVLHVAPGERKRGEWTTRPRLGPDRDPQGKLKRGPRMYQLSAAALDDDDQGAAESGGPAGPCPRCVVPGESCGTASTAPESLPCVGCGVPTHTRSLCGAPRKFICRGPAPLPAPPAPPAPPAAVDQGVAEVAPPAAGRAVDVPPAPPAPAASTSPRGAPPRAAARTVAKADRLAADLAVLDAGQPVKILDALIGEYAPLRRGDGGRMRQPFWRPELPGVTFAAHIVTGWAWSRPYEGPATVLDRSGAWVSAASSATVAHGPLEHTGPAEFEGRPGLYRTTVYPWHETGMPCPLGNPGRPEVWVPAPTVALLRDLAEAGRWPDVAIEDSYTGDGARLTDWAAYVAELRRYAIETYGRDSEQYDGVKTAFGQAMSLMLGAAGEESIMARKWKTGAQRPDWTHTLQAQASATLWRRADECRQLGPEVAPVALRNVDELVIPSAGLTAATTGHAPGRTRPAVVIDPQGIKLGTFKVKNIGPWGGI